MAWTLPDTAAAGDAGHVTDHNLILTALSSMNNTWTSYTPTLGGSGWAIGNGTITAAYCYVAANAIALRIKLSFGSSSTYGGSVPTLTFPVTATSGWNGINEQFHVGFLDISSGSFYKGAARANNTSSFLLASLTTSGLHTNCSSTSPFTWTTSDEMTVTGVYEVA